jgi:hypothetical protein
VRFVVLGTPAIGAKHFFSVIRTCVESWRRRSRNPARRRKRMALFGGVNSPIILPSEKLTSCSCYWTVRKSGVSD